MITGSLVSLAGVFASMGQMQITVAVIAGILAAGETVRFISPGLNRLFLRFFGGWLKEQEHRGVTGVTYGAIGALAVFFLFPKPVAVAALLFLSLGDAVAAMVGSRWGRPKFYGKSWQGSLSFFAVAALAGLFLWVGGVAGPYWPLLVGAAVASLTEMWPLRIDDNLAVPLVSGGVMYLLPLT